jgi:hypothetical protein
MENGRGKMEEVKWKMVEDDTKAEGHRLKRLSISIVIARSEAILKRNT